MNSSFKNGQNKKPSPGRNRLFDKLILTCVLASLIGCISYYGYQYYLDIQQRQLAAEARKIYEEAKPIPAPPATPVPTPTPIPEPTPEPVPTPAAIRSEFLALQEQYQNEDIVGYLRIEGTTIDYPVVQAEDNEYYLERDIYRKPSSAGWLYLDYENDVSLEDKNAIIYGHNMKADIMFHSLRRYVSEDFFKAHPIITFNTLYEDCEWEIFSFYRTHVSFNYIQVLFPSTASFLELATQMKEKSIYNTGVSIEPEDRILTLSTCTNEDPNTRFVLNARLIRKNVSAEGE